MKKINKFLPILMTACLLGSVGAATIDTVVTSAATAENTTIEVQSGYKTSFFGDVSNYSEKKGVSIEFDLYKSDFKEMDYNKDFDIMQSSQTYGGLASISFTFARLASGYPDPYNPQCPGWHTYDLREHNFGGFQYFCNGEIKEWHDIGNAMRITDYIGYPSQFMEEGYSYKVMLRYDRFEFEGVTYNTDGDAWFCVERKTLFEEESNYEILFAYKKKLIGSYADGSLAGVDIQGLSIQANGSQGVTSADGEGHSLHLELDNVRIYDGKDYNSADKKYAETFDNVSSSAIATPESVTLDGAELVQYNGKNYSTLPSGMRLIAVNFGRQMGFTDDAPCRMNLNTRALYNVTFKDADTNDVVGAQKTFTSYDFSTVRIFKGEQVYQFDYSNVNFDNVTGDVEVFGKPVSYFTLSLFGNAEGIKDKTLRVGVTEKVTLKKDLFTRPGYNLVGFLNKDTNTEYPIGTILDLKCQNVTLYAVWQAFSFTTSYKMGNKTLYSVNTGEGVVPFYQGATPEMPGQIFSGWTQTISASKDQTIAAKFITVSDVNAKNKAMSVADSITFTRDVYGNVAVVDICFDLIAMPNGAKVIVCGVDISDLMVEGYKMRVSISDAGNMVISKAYIGTDTYTKIDMAQTDSGNNSVIEFTFENGVVFDTLSFSYDGKNTFTQTFEGVNGINAGIYDNYYTVTGSASAVAKAKDKTVTFVDTTTGREVAKAYTYVGGHVKLIDTVDGAVGTVAWDKEQSELHNIQDNITVNATLAWSECSISFVIPKILGFMEVEDVYVAPIGALYGSEVILPTASYGDYAIIGWTDIENGVFVKYSNTYTIKDDNLILYAVWGGKLLTVEFYAEDGKTLLETQTVESKATVRCGVKVPEKPGYKFVGWDKSTVGVTEDTKFVAQYEKILKKVQVSVLGGTGAGRYTEGDVVTIAFRDIKGIEFVEWKVVSGGVTINEKNGVYTFVVGDQDVVIQAMRDGENVDGAGDDGCSSTISMGVLGVISLLGCGCVVLKRRNEE